MKLTEHQRELLQAVLDDKELINTKTGELLSFRNLAFYFASTEENKISIKPKTVMVNGIEVPEPITSALNNGDRYFKAGRSEVYEWRNDRLDILWLNQGILHLTKEAADLHWEAMIAPTKKG